MGRYIINKFNNDGYVKIKIFLQKNILINLKQIFKHI